MANETRFYSPFYVAIKSVLFQIEHGYYGLRCRFVMITRSL